MRNVTIREIRHNDVKDVCILLDSCFHDEYRTLDFDIMEYNIPFRIISIINTVLRKFGLEFMKVFVAECENKIAGISIGYRYDCNIWYYGFFATHPDYRGLGIYNKLMSAHLKAARDRKNSRMVCEIVEGNNGPLHVWIDKLKATKTSISSVYILDPKKNKSSKKINFVESYIPEDLSVDYKPLTYSKYSRSRSLLDCIFKWLVPPTMIKTIAYKEENKTQFFARIMVAYPSKMIKVDLIRHNSSDNLSDIFSSFISYLTKMTEKKILIYVLADDKKLKTICESFHLKYFYDTNSLEFTISKWNFVDIKFSRAKL